MGDCKMEAEEDIRTIYQVGKSLVLSIPQKYVKAHKLKPGDKVRVFFNDFLHVRPVEKEKLLKKLEMMKETFERYPESFAKRINGEGV